jgi:hypothetical protein
MLPLPPYDVPIPIHVASFLGVTRPDTPVPICHQVLVDFDGPQGALVVYVPKAEIFPNHKRANEYIPEKPETTYGPDPKTRFVNASQAIERFHKAANDARTSMRQGVIATAWYRVPVPGTRNGTGTGTGTCMMPLHEITFPLEDSS